MYGCVKIQLRAHASALYSLEVMHKPPKIFLIKLANFSSLYNNHVLSHCYFLAYLIFQIIRGIFKIHPESPYCNKNVCFPYLLSLWTCSCNWEVYAVLYSALVPHVILYQIFFRLS